MAIEDELRAAEKALEGMAGPQRDELPVMEILATAVQAGMAPPSDVLASLPETRYRTLLEQIPAVTFMATFGKERAEAYVSPQIEALLGYGQKEWCENPTLWYERLHPEDRDRWFREFVPLISTGDHFHADYRFLARDGRVVWILGDIRIVRDDAGRPLFIQGVGFDITEVRRAEQAVREAKESLQEIVTTIREAFWVLSPDLDRILFASPTFATVWGLAAAGGAAALLGAVHPADRENVSTAFERARTMETDLEHRVESGGAARWIRTRTFPVRDGRGEVIRVIAVTEDVTRRKELEEQVQQAQRRHVARLVSKVKSEFEPDRLAGSSQAMERVRADLRKLAQSGATVLIRGESGTGKKLAAQTLHYAGPRAQGRFFDVNCAAFSETLLHSELFGHEKGSFTGAHQRRPGLFEQANGGTLFLDEIGDMPLNVQATILKVLEERSFRRLGGDEDIRVDVRVVCATNRDLEEAVKKGAFRLDLYYRIRGRVIELPPLRERPDDIPELAQKFLDATERAGLAVSPAAMERLRAHAWPGNVRELKDAVERAADYCEGDTIQPGDLPREVAQVASRPAAPAGTPRLIEGMEVCERALISALDGGMGLDAVTAQVQRSVIGSALKKSGGVKTVAARQLQLNERRLTYMMNSLGM